MSSRDLVMAACDEAARKREARRGRIPTQATVRGDWEACMRERWVSIVLTPCMADPPSVLAQWRPYDVTDSWPHRWHRQLHWRRCGPAAACCCVTTSAQQQAVMMMMTAVHAQLDAGAHGWRRDQAELSACMCSASAFCQNVDCTTTLFAQLLAMHYNRSPDIMYAVPRLRMRPYPAAPWLAHSIASIEHTAEYRVFAHSSMGHFFSMNTPENVL